MKEVNYLPLGTIIIAKGEAKRKVMIIARGMLIDIEGSMRLFDYGGCLYPEGFFGDRVLYFNDEDIEDILFKGYSDEDDKNKIEQIKKWVEEHDIEKGNVTELKKLLEKHMKTK